MLGGMETLRLGVIGTGSVVREIYEHLYFRSAYSRFISVEAICDTSDDALEAFGTTCHSHNIMRDSGANSSTRAWRRLACQPGNRTAGTSDDDFFTHRNPPEQLREVRLGLVDANRP